MNLNPIDFNYIDGENVYPIQEYIDNIVSNDLTTSNIFLNNNLKINDVVFYKDSNLYLKNKLGNGEIRFSTATNYPVDTNFDYGTRINFFGKLEVYHNYNILQPLFTAGWYSVVDEILQLKADGISTDIQLTGLEASVVYLQEQITSSADKVGQLELFQRSFVNAYTRANSFEEFQQVLFAPRSPAAIQFYNSSLNAIRIRSQDAYAVALGYGALYGVGIGIGGAILGYIGSRIESDNASNALYKNSNLTFTEKNEIYNTPSNLESNVSNISNFNSLFSNLNIIQGFTNSNIITTQYINSLNTNEIKINNLNLSNIFVSSNVYLNSSNIAFNTNSNFTFNSSNVNSNYTYISSNVNYLYSSNNNSNINYNLPINVNNMTFVSKKKGFTCDVQTAISINGTTYYKYDIDLRKYITYTTIGGGSSQANDMYRIFRISICLASMYFDIIDNYKANVLNYDIMMSYKYVGLGAGLNINAYGNPPNPKLDTILPDLIFLLKNGVNDFNYITICTKTPLVARVVIEDFIS